ncbi:MAG: hypothetical protein M9904_04205 [Chitinophagaceae bacterium]|nr:hypothetical protein [Chitinophagaceae bacterium]
MRLLLTIFCLCLCSKLFAQPAYTYVDPNPQLEADKKAKEAYFKNWRQSASQTLENCLRGCGHFEKGHAHDANDPDPCHHSSSQMRCECNCSAQYKSTINDIDKQEQDWLKTAAQRQQDYENKKIKEQQNELDKQNKLQQQQDLQNQQQAAAQQKSNQIQEQFNQQEQRSQQTQMELDNAKNVSVGAYQQAINSGKKTSGAMVDATLEGAQYISDPKASLAYTGIGLGVALVSWISEKKEVQRTAMFKREEEERLRRLEELKSIKASLSTSTSVFEFIESTTNYHITNLKIQMKRGMVKSILRKDLYDIEARIYDVINTRDSLFIIEMVKFKNLNAAIDSCIVNKISIPFQYISEAILYDGDYTNAYDPKSSTDQVFRHKNLTNVDIKNAFTIVPMFNEGDAIGKIKSGLYDATISTIGNHIMVQRRYFQSMPTYIKNSDFAGVSSFSVSHYNLVFDDDDYSLNKLYNFVDYLNFIKN